MRNITATLKALALVALVVSPAYAAQDNLDGRVQGGVDLSVYDFVIGDMGDMYETWGDSPTRIRADVMDNNRTSKRYFDSLPAALYVLGQLYDKPNITQMDVLDYAGLGPIDSRQAYYVWDYEQQSRGGLPLVLAFDDYQTALAESLYRNSEVLDYDNVVKAVNHWEAQDRDRIYWRGRDRDHWDSGTWNTAWDNRWQGWGWDHDYGWSKADARQAKEDRQADRDKQDKGDRTRGKGHEKNKDNPGHSKGKGKGHKK